MADCNELFKHYNATIRLSEQNRQLLLAVRNGLRDRMRTRFNQLPAQDRGTHLLEFHSQGSFVMDTIITPWDDDFDLDDGIYFAGRLDRDSRAKPDVFHDLVLRAIDADEHYGEVTDKDTCVRVKYPKEKFHIDLPIYYADNNDNPDLAHKKEGWILSNPIKFILWFENKVQSGFKEAFIFETALQGEYRQWKEDIRKTDAQLRRIVRYLKGWADLLRGDMPPGIVMTILAADNYIAHERDDIALRDTLVKIKEKLDKEFKCLRPTDPIGEDLFENYSDTRKQYILDRLETFINSANLAISNPSQKEACLKWQKHLGDRFPCSLAKDDNSATIKTHSSAAIIGDSAKSA